MTNRVKTETSVSRKHELQVIDNGETVKRTSDKGIVRTVHKQRTIAANLSYRKPSISEIKFGNNKNRSNGKYGISFDA